MGWSQVEGQFTRLYSWVDDEANGYDIDSTRMDADTDDIAAGISACLHKAGENSPTANLPMGTHKHTGCADATELDEYATVKQVQNFEFNYPDTVGVQLNGNQYQIEVSPAPTAYAAGQQFTFKASATNSGALQLNVNGLGYKDVYSNGAVCSGDEITTGRVYTFVYDGTRFHIVGNNGGSGSGSTYGGARVSMSSPQLLTHGNYTTIAIRNQNYDDDNAYYTPNTSFLSIPETGRYRLTAGVRLGYYNDVSTKVGDIFATAIFKRNLSLMQASATTSSVPSELQIAYYFLPSVSLVWEGELTAGDAIYLQVYYRNAYGLERITAVGDNDVNTEDSTYVAIERIY